MSLKKTIPILFRCDGGKEIGMGHIVGSIRLANLLVSVNKYIRPIFLTKRNSKVIDYLKKKEFECFSIKQNGNVSEQITAIKKLCNTNGIKLVVFNFNAYELKLWGKLFSEIKKSGLKIVFQDNPTKSFKYGDLVWNALPHPVYSGYSSNVYNRVYDGLQYILFDTAFDRYMKLKRSVRNQRKRILVSMGGADDRNITLFVLKSLEKMRCNYLIDVVVGSSYAHLPTLERYIAVSRLDIILSVNINDMAKKIWSSDFGVCSLGLTTYEMAALGLPAIIISSHEFNHMVSELYCRKYGFAKYVGLIDYIDSATFIDVFSNTLEDLSFFKHLQDKRKNLFLKVSKRIRLAEEIVRLSK